MVNGYLLRDVINKVNDIHFTSKDEIHTLGHLYETMLREMRDAAGDSGEFYTPRAVVKFIVAAVNPKLGETILDPAAGTGGFLVEAFEHLRNQAKRAQDYERLQHGTLHGIEAKPLPYLLCEMNLLLHGVEYPEINSGNALRFPLREIGDRDRVDVIMTNRRLGAKKREGYSRIFQRISRPPRQHSCSFSSLCGSYAAPLLETGRADVAWSFRTVFSLATAFAPVSRQNSSRSSIYIRWCACQPESLRPTRQYQRIYCFSTVLLQLKMFGITSSQPLKAGKVIPRRHR
jgi:type I restriction-modification system DNA methylase subunit